MIGDDGNRVCGFLEILVPFFQSQDYRKEFMVIDVIVVLCGGEGVGEVCTRVQI